MKKFNVMILLMSLLLIVGGLSVGMLSGLERNAVRKDQVYVILKTKNESVDFWQNAVEGAEIAATELGVAVVVDGPVNEVAIDEQIRIVEAAIAEAPEAIAIAACDYDALAEVCDRAHEEGITVVTFDSDADMVTEHSFVATDNFSAAQRIAHELATLTGGSGNVAVIGHVEGAYTSIERIQGFVQGIKPFEGYSLVGDVIYANDSRELAYSRTLELLEEHPELNAIFTTNEVALRGVGEAVRDLGMKDKVTVVGFDMSEDIALMIEQEVIDGTMVQRPFNMGYIAIREALEVMNGKETEAIDTGAVLINKENMFLPENQKLIVP